MDGSPERTREHEGVSAHAPVDELVFFVDRSGRIQWAEGSLDALGWSGQQLCARRVGEVGLAARLGPLHDELARCLAGAAPWSGTLQLGPEHHLAGRVTPLREHDGVVSGALVRLRDETELHRLRALAAGVNLADKVGQVFPGIRHELGNPVNSLKVALTVLRSNWTKLEARRVDDYFDRMLAELARIEHLLRSLRGFSALDQPIVERIDARALVQQIEGLTRSTTRPSGLRLVVECEDTLELAGDVRALHQVLLNLLSNALDAVAGRVRASIVVRVAGRGEWVAIEVIDDGPGIEPALRELVRRPFFTTKREGSGLGLAIVERLVLAMRGRLELDERPGGGTIARVLLESWRDDGAR
jgi:signal transduction histidine kinase